MGTILIIHMRTGTYFILDGLQDPRLGQSLSAAWANGGFVNEVDVSGQSARLAVADEGSSAERPLEEHEARVAGRIARRFGIELRDRAGTNYIGENDLSALRRQTVYEYRMRLAQTLVFVGPALVLHHAAPMLAPGAADADGARALAFPWLFEMLLVGWACWVGGWPILWQGTLAAIHRRMTADALTLLIVVAAFVPSAIGVISLTVVDRPWFGAGGPAIHAAGIALVVAVYQRWAAHRYANVLAGRAAWIVPFAGRAVGLWLIVGLVIAVLTGWRVGLSVWMLLPPLFALGGVSRLTPGLAAALPVFGFLVLFLMGPRVLGADLEPVRFETAGGFALIVAWSYEWGWRGLRVAGKK